MDIAVKKKKKIIFLPLIIIPITNLSKILHFFGLSSKKKKERERKKVKSIVCEYMDTIALST